MSIQSKTMPVLDLKMYVRVVAAVFSVSSLTALVMAVLRLVNPDLYYTEALDNDQNLIHYFVTVVMIGASLIGLLNSCIVLSRRGALNEGRNITTWLLLQSLFETSRVVYVFVSEVMLKGRGQLQMLDLAISVTQYLVDSFLYCQMILRH
ncbi:uncharacterized protein LOC121730202 [Aricia agestis]|uniref:uncharacterized protein LOC121730202 n=1 Tax=Aricia agestis TaxID=91739 RepID=UPI001C205A4C|nr:uncharacterized protein LOC121730202 [Aricia agestis]XP_041975083.1 uncharacterized protein LOC121730202 [Aricia agestis]